MQKPTINAVPDPPDVASSTAVRRFSSREEALQHLQQWDRPGEWFVAAWTVGCGLGWIVARGGTIAG